MRLSVVIPFYNLERYACACLDSLVAACARLEAEAEIEVVCVDDGSTDATPRLLDGFVSGAPQRHPGAASIVPRVLHKANGGEGSARNAGLDAAAGDWVTFLDGDDVWLANHLRVALPLLAAQAAADVVAFRYASFDDGGPLPAASDGGVPEIFDTRTALPDRCLLDVGVFPTFFRRDWLSRIGVRFSPLPLGADRLFVAECLARADRVVCSDAEVHGYRVRTGSMAHAAWNARKVTSLCDYAVGSLAALAASGKRLGRAGCAYLASLWLSDVPNRIARLRGDERREAAARWAQTLQADNLLKALPRFDRARRLLLRLCFSPTLALAVARLLRKGGIT